MPIPIRVEEHRVDVFAQTVDLKRALRARAERAVASLDEEPAGLPLGAPDVDVVAAVAVDVADGQGGPFARQEVRDQDRKSTRLNSSHSQISYAVFCLK